MTAITRSEDHHYTYEGVTYPGVTGILKVLDKSDALMAWAARNTAEAAIRMLDTLPSMIGTVGEDGVVKALTSRSSWINQQAKDLGSEIHRLADLVNTGTPTPPMEGDVRTRVLSYAEWLRNSGWRVRASEAMLIDPDLGYGGTLDLLAYDRDGRTVLADIKSGRIDYRGKVYDSIILQLAAYGMAKVGEIGTTLFNMPKVDRYAVIHVTMDGTREVEVNVGALEREAFAACVRLSAWRESVKGKRL
jgi:hypothetical protein